MTDMTGSRQVASLSRGRVIAIVGPTASGKSDLALGVAHALGGEIISADSMQVYRGLDIGTAKPGPEDLALVPHHLIDVADPDQNFSVATFVQLAREAISAIQARGRLPVLAGGTGLYVRATLSDYDFSAPGQDPATRQRLAERAAREGPEQLHQELMQSDPVAAGRINPRDARRIIRALEVLELTGRPISASWGDLPPLYDALVVGLRVDRPLLYHRIDERVRSMVRRGLVDEVRSLVDRGFTPALVSGQALGYNEMVGYLEGQTTLDEAVSQVMQATRNYAKRQMSWFRREPGIIWLEGPGSRQGPLVATVLGLAAAKWGQCC